MTKPAYYNEIDPVVAKWLRNLIARGVIAPGDVDERSIEDVRPDDLVGYRQCHFFAGIGVWSYALRRAGISDDTPVWTGSCPCQPFSAAGKGDGFADERHLWPAFFHLIEQRRPPVVLGEQVASQDADPWIDLVCDDLESLDYACGALAFPAAGVGAPNIRDRLYWVGHSRGARLQERIGQSGVLDRTRGADAREATERTGVQSLWLADPLRNGTRPATGNGDRTEETTHRINGRAARACVAVGDSGSPFGLADADGGNTGAEGLQRSWQHGLQSQDGGIVWSRDSWARPDPDGAWPGPTNGFWADADWLLCRDGRWRPVEPGTFPLAHGAAGRVGRLRAYGNAINAEAARIFIECFDESLREIVAQQTGAAA